MKSLPKSCVFAAMVLAALTSVLAPHAAAQIDGVIRGQIIDIAGKPWAELTIQAISDQGAKVETKTDASGNYVFRNLRSGIFTVRVMLPAPNPHTAKPAATPRISGNHFCNGDTGEI